MLYQPVAYTYKGSFTLYTTPLKGREGHLNSVIGIAKPTWGARQLKKIDIVDNPIVVLLLQTIDIINLTSPFLKFRILEAPERIQILLKHFQIRYIF